MMLCGDVALPTFCGLGCSSAAASLPIKMLRKIPKWKWYSCDDDKLETYSVMLHEQRLALPSFPNAFSCEKQG